MTDNTNWGNISKIPLKNETFEKKDVIAQILKKKYAQKERIKKLRLFVMRTAACLALLSGGGIGVAYLASSMRVATGTLTAQHILPDGSVVTIYPASEIRYNKLSWKISRNVTMNGTAEFNVVKSETPFQVKTSLLDVYVLGTIFKISELESGVTDISCKQGAVLVKSPVTEQQLGPDSKLTIAESSFSFSDKLTEHRADSPDKRVSANSLTFEAIPLSELVSEMQHIYKQNFSIAPENGSILYSGPLFSNDLDISLELISRSCNIRIRRENDTIILY